MLDRETLEVLERHGLTNAHLQQLRTRLEAHQCGSWRWHYSHGYLCDMPHALPQHFREVTARILRGERLEDAERYWGIKAWRLRRMVVQVCQAANPQLFAEICHREHFVLTALRAHKAAFGIVDVIEVAEVSPHARP